MRIWTKSNHKNLNPRCEMAVQVYYNYDFRWDMSHKLYAYDYQF